jgi:hypothetical protein
MLELKVTSLVMGRNPKYSLMLLPHKGYLLQKLPQSGLAIVHLNDSPLKNAP